MMDFIELTPCGKQKHCLVMVDMWSKWVEAFPTSKQDSAAVAKALLTEIVSRWGIPRKISSDNGRHFVNDAIKQVGQFLGIDMRTHCSYAPSSGGAVERQNQTIKNKLAKCCEETGLTWLKALPIVLMYMRMRKEWKQIWAHLSLANCHQIIRLRQLNWLLWQRSVILWQTSVWQFTQTRVMLLGSRIDFGALWKHRNFLKSDGYPILNASLVSKLLEAIILPDKVAICKCAAHTNDKRFISTGNARADAAAKAAAAQETKETTCALVSVTNPDISPCLQSMQSFSTGAEKTTMEVVWLQSRRGCMDECWWHSLFAQTLLSALC